MLYHMHGYGCGHAGYGIGGPVVIPVPVPVYVPVVSGYTYSANPYTGMSGPQPPTIIVIQQPPPQDQATEAEDRPRHCEGP